MTSTTIANPLADPRPLAACDKCGCGLYTDQAIHAGESILRTCNHCGRFLGWPRWYGRPPGGIPCETRGEIRALGATAKGTSVQKKTTTPGFVAGEPLQLGSFAVDST
jgi:hypothetical protein